MLVGLGCVERVMMVVLLVWGSVRGTSAGSLNQQLQVVSSIPVAVLNSDPHGSLLNP